jgi:hypothetical protein
MNPSKSDESQSSLPRRFPTWPGVLAALALGGVLAGADALGLFPAVLGGLVGKVMIAAHALAVLAIVTLAGEAYRITLWNRELAQCRKLPDHQRTGWPIDALEDARKRLYKRHSTSEIRAEIAKTAELMLARQQWAWRLSQMMAFLIPAIGFAMSLWVLRIEGNTIPWREVGMPLVVALGESVPVLLFGLGVRNLAQLTMKEWGLFAEEMAVERQPEGYLSNPQDDEEADLVPDDLASPARAKTVTPSQEAARGTESQGAGAKPPRTDAPGDGRRKDEAKKAETRPIETPGKVDDTRWY